MDPLIIGSALLDVFLTGWGVFTLYQWYNGGHQANAQDNTANFRVKDAATIHLSHTKITSMESDLAVVLKELVYPPKQGTARNELARMKVSQAQMLNDLWWIKQALKSMATVTGPDVSCKPLVTFPEEIPYDHRAASPTHSNSSQ